MKSKFMNADKRIVNWFKSRAGRQQGRGPAVEMVPRRARQLGADEEARAPCQLTSYKL